jgi:hypothetical protein
LEHWTWPTATPPGASKAVLDLANLFELAIHHRLGDKIRLSNVWAEAVWSAIANTRWEHANGYTATYNTQAAGDLIAAIRGVGDYRHWADNCRVYKSIPGMIFKMMAEEGWSSDLKRRENGSSFA